MTELTPDDVREVVFDHAPMFHRGYDEAQVDEFLDRVETAMIALHGALAQNQQVVDHTALRTTDPHGPPSSAGHDHRLLGDQVIADARRQADQIVQNARAAAQQVVEEARAEAFRLVANASRQIVGAGAPGRPGDRELAMAAAEIGDRIAQIRDALSVEVSHLYDVVDHLNNGHA
jgi:DivIVA domain-containing protein